MIVLSGQLGNTALGSTQLGRAPVYGIFAPHRGRARSALTVNAASSAIRRGNQVSSTIRSNGARSEVSNG